jgi:hypothetical protein
MNRTSGFQYQLSPALTILRSPPRMASGASAPDACRANAPEAPPRAATKAAPASKTLLHGLAIEILIIANSPPCPARPGGPAATTTVM